MDYSRIPEELKNQNQWVCAWDGSKVPMRAFERKAASSTAPDTWSTFEQAEWAVENGHYDHIGYVFADQNIVGIDIDAGFEDGLMLDAIQHLLGDYSTVTPVELICRGDRAKNAEAASPVLAKLKGKRMVTMSESDTAGKLDESVIKQLTGGEEITARELYQTAITFKPQFTMWLSCNDLPAVKDKSLFASDRVRVIEFNRHFNDDEQDKGLKDYFESPEAMRGIFTWLVAGYFKYRRFGLKMSANMQKVVKQYEKDNDLVLQYLEEKCQKQDDVKTRAKTLYDNYKLWCKSNGYYVCSMKKFNAELMAHPEWYEQKSVSGGVAVYYGIMMKTTG